jgi:transcriptional regulator with XRE-family HTH domain
MCYGLTIMNDKPAPEIGPVVQRRRAALGLTLKQLAARSGVSKSMLSQIERSQANPTFAVLWSLTRALKLEFADLLQGAEGPQEKSAIEIVAAAATPEIHAADGRCRLRILGPPRLAGAAEWYEIAMAPGGALDSAPHAGGAFEHFTAIEGTFEIISGEAKSRLVKGETARYPADVAHRIANAGPGEARGVLVVLYG